MPIAKPKDLAHNVHSYFKDLDVYPKLPSLATLEEMFDLLFYVSLYREEGESIKITIAYYTDSSTPRRKRFNPEKWSLNEFAEPFALTVSNLAKLAKAADPWSTMIAVSVDSDEKLIIKGLYDQAIHLQSYLNLEDESRPDFPGIFHISVSDTGTLTVYSDFELIATLKKDELIHKYLNVFSVGPVANFIEEIASNINEKTREQLIRDDYDSQDIQTFLSKSKITSRNALSRILNKIQGYNHGGALLITNATSGLDIKYKISYERLNTTIMDLKINDTKINIQTPDDDEVDPEGDSFYRNLRYKKLLYGKELKGTIRFIASLSRVDGLIVMDKNLYVKGFGAIVTKLNYPSEIYISSSIRATPKSLTTRPLDQFGTRHKSMISFCNNYPGSMGFVVSQDGDIRAIMKVDEKLVIWNHIQLQKYR